MNQSEEVIFVIKKISSELTYEIRKKVLWQHITNGDYSLPIDNNPSTFHLGAFINEKLISIGTFVNQNNPKFNSKKQYRLRAMATEKKNRIKGAGKALFIEGLKILKKKDIKILWCDARINAIPFYEKLNMISLDNVYEIINIGPHKTMYIDIK